MRLDTGGDPIWEPSEFWVLRRIDPFFAPLKCKRCGEEIEWTIDGQVFGKDCKCTKGATP